MASVPRLLLNLDVPDLPCAIAFYEAGLGFTPCRHLFAGTVAEMTLDGVYLYLLEKEAGTPAFPGTEDVRCYASHWTPLHLDLVVDDLPAATERALAAGAKRSGTETSAPWGRLAPMRDPFGHGFCLLEFSEEGYGLT